VTRTLEERFSGKAQVFTSSGEGSEKKNGQREDESSLQYVRSPFLTAATCQRKSDRKEEGGEMGMGNLKNGGGSANILIDFRC